VTVEAIRKLGFGGILGAGAMAAAIYFWPQIFPATLGPTFLLPAGAAVGGMFSDWVSRGVGFILPEATNFIGSYEKMIEATILRMLGIITPEKHNEIINSMIDRRFPGPGGPPQLPPAPTA
jgi:hypothetical protein